MKRLISILLVLILSLSVFPMSLAADEMVLTDAEQKAVDMMFTFGIMETNKFGKFNAALPVTRAEFCQMLTEVLNIYPADTAAAQIFADVPADHEAAGAIEVVYKMEIMKGENETTFAPDKDITFQEAVTALIRALGYEQLVSYTGGWFVGYYQKAKDIGLLKGLSSTEEHTLNKAEVAVLLKNFMKSDVFAVIEIHSNGGVTREAVEGRTILSEYRQILYVDDILKENQHTGLYKTGDYDRAHLKIGDTVLKSSNYDLTEYLGYRMEAWYDEETTEVVYYEISDKNEVLKVDNTKSPYISNAVLYYTEGDKEVHKDLKNDPAYIYNQKAMKTYDESLFRFETGYFELVDNNGDGDYDVVKIKSYQTGVIEVLDVPQGLITLSGRSTVINLESYTKASIYDANGAEMATSYLHTGDVLSVLDNAAEGFIEIIASQQKVSAKLSGISEEYGVQYLTLDNGETYPALKAFFTNYPYVKIGSSGTFRLDAFGNVVGYKALPTDSYIYAYILGTNYKGSLLSEELKLRLLTEEGALVIVDAAKTVEVDGIRYKENPQGVISAITYKETALSSDGVTVLDVDTEATVNHLVRVKFDEDGKLKSINTTQQLDGEVQEEKFEPFQYDVMKNGVEWHETPAQFGHKVFTAGDCKMFLIPDDLAAASDDDFSVLAPASYLWGSTKFFDVLAYKTDPDEVTCNAVVRKVPIRSGTSSFSPGQYERLYVIEKITEVIDEDGELTNKVYYYYQGNHRVALAKDLTVMAGVGPGDALFLHKNEKDRIDAYKMLYSYANNLLTNNQLSRQPVIDEETGLETEATEAAPGFGYNSANKGAGHRAILGEVEKLYTDVYNVCVNGKDSQAPEYEYHRYTNTYLVENRNGQIKVTVGKKSDMLDYTTSPDMYSKVFCFQTYAYDYDMIIYNEYK